MPGVERKAPPDREHRIQDATVSPIDRHHWILPTAAPSNHACAIRFIFERGIIGWTFNDELRYPDRRVLFGTQTPPGKQRLQFGPRFSLYEELAESRVRAIRVVGSKTQLSRTDQCELPAAQTMIDESKTADFGVVFRRHRHFHVRFDSELAPPELSAICSEGRGVTRVFHIQRLMCQRPDRLVFFFG